MNGQLERSAFRRSQLFVAAVLTCAWISVAGHAHALSALQDMPGTDGQSEEQERDDSVPPPGLPLPDPLIGSSQSTPAPTVLPLNGGKPAQPIYDESKLPEAVRRTRQLLVEAAASGDIERLRPLIGEGRTATDVSVGETAGDPVDTLKQLAGDDQGIEVLAAFLNILSTGYVHVDQGTAREAYVWPYFAARPLDKLTPPEKVELLRIVTAGDYQDMLDFAAYSFFRIGIAPYGRLSFIRTGE